ncbi:uncharacterized protein EDB91DRAFT_1087878 [Suillus paluster]|uniref:uncharacterized protein n=1 Tax=Suillus paluster TaxID=48578 RepID=UPI001B86C00F|nr:uncharacterized protein EDB91DRAFT_1087878 [Suillus paluster]KAG1723253.1 hypothetical protein EDB91DRAFT_1087878 [Suillus paluster]
MKEEHTLNLRLTMDGMDPGQMSRERERGLTVGASTSREYEYELVERRSRRETYLELEVDYGWHGRWERQELAERRDKQETYLELEVDYGWHEPWVDVQGETARLDSGRIYIKGARMYKMKYSPISQLDSGDSRRDNSLIVKRTSRLESRPGCSLIVAPVGLKTLLGVLFVSLAPLVLTICLAIPIICTRSLLCKAHKLPWDYSTFLPLLTLRPYTPSLICLCTPDLIIMPTAWDKFTPYMRADPTITSLDARAIVYQYPLVITTPNMDWIPELQNDNLDELKARADGHFGVVDCFQWPQMFCKEFEYAVCIPCKDTLPFSFQFVWYTPTTADFVIQPGTAFAVGTLHSYIIDSINNLLTIARKRVEAWKVTQAGKNNIIVQPRLTMLSWSSWSTLPGDPKWMGCFTDDSKTCDTFLDAVEAYIPRDMNIIKPVILMFPDNITKSIFSEPGKVVQPFPLLYRGHGGFNHHFHTRRAYAGTFGMNPLSPALPQNPASGKVPSQGQQNKKARKIALSQLMKMKNPESIGFWHLAFQKADKDKGCIKQGLVDQGYWFPEPALLITPMLLEQKKLFVANWLAARPLWISHVNHNPPEKFPPPQLWRDFLNSPTAAAKRKQAAPQQIFSEDLLDADGSTWAIQATLVWRNETISVASLSDPPARLMRRILWELYELNFHYELQALNRVMAIFPGEGGFVSPIPEGDRGGLWSCEIRDVFPYVDSFCNVLSSWENAPLHLSASLDASPPSFRIVFPRDFVYVLFGDVALPAPLHVPKNGGHEQSANDKDSGIFTDDTTIVDSPSELPTIKQVANVDTNAIPDDEEVESEVQQCIKALMIPWVRHHLKTATMATRLSPALTDGDANELPTHVNQGAKGTKPPPPPAQEYDAHQDPQDPNANNHLAPGRLLVEAMRKAIALGERTFKEATEIAKEYEKSPGAILIAAGLSVKPT